MNLLIFLHYLLNVFIDKNVGKIKKNVKNVKEHDKNKKRKKFFTSMVCEKLGVFNNLSNHWHAGYFSIYVPIAEKSADVQRNYRGEIKRLTLFWDTVYNVMINVMTFH